MCFDCRSGDGGLVDHGPTDRPTVGGLDGVASDVPARQTAARGLAVLGVCRMNDVCFHIRMRFCFYVNLATRPSVCLLLNLLGRSKWVKFDSFLDDDCVDVLRSTIFNGAVVVVICRRLL